MRNTLPIGTCVAAATLLLLLVGSPVAEAIQFDTLKMRFTLAVNAPLTDAGLAELESGLRANSFASFPNPEQLQLLTEQSGSSSSIFVTMGVPIPTSTPSTFLAAVKTTFIATQEGDGKGNQDSVWNKVITQTNSTLNTATAISDVVVNGPCWSWIGGMCEDGTRKSTTGLTFGVQVAGSFTADKMQGVLCFAAAFTAMEQSCDEIQYVATGTAVEGSSVYNFYMSPNLGNNINIMDKLILLITTYTSNSHPSWTSSAIQLQKLSVISTLLSGASSPITGTIYDNGETNLADVGDGASTVNDIPCELQDYWWMILLIVIGPVGSICMRWVYSTGKRHGVKKGKKEIDESQNTNKQMDVMMLQKQQQQQQGGEQQQQPQQFVAGADQASGSPNLPQQQHNVSMQQVQ